MNPPPPPKKKTTTTTTTTTRLYSFYESKSDIYRTRHQAAWEFHQSGRWSKVFRDSVRPPTYFQSSCQIPQIVCDNALNVLWVVSHSYCVADKVVLLSLDRVLVFYEPEYGSIFCGSGTRSDLSKLDAVHRTGLRSCLGAFRTSSVKTLYIKTGETSQSHLRMRLARN